MSRIDSIDCKLAIRSLPTLVKKRNDHNSLQIKFWVKYNNSLWFSRSSLLLNGQLNGVITKRKKPFTEINPASLPCKCKWTISTLWTLESTWVFLGRWRVFCFSAGKLEWLELGLGSAPYINFDDHSMSFWLRTSSLSVTKATIRVNLRSNKWYM